MSAHDRHLAGYRRWTETAWCSNRECTNHGGVEVEVQSEYGQSWATPEECWLCHGEWLWERPEEDDEDV